MDTRRKRRIAKLFVFVLPAFVALSAGMIWAVYALWNWLMPTLFGLHTVTYWQALGLVALSWILFRGPRGPHVGHGAWRHAMRERFGRMTPAEREEFLKAFNGRWAGPPPEPETKG